MKSSLFHILLLSTLFLWMSCTAEEPDQETRMQMLLDDKKETYLKEQTAVCKDKWKRIANNEVDSILRLRSKSLKLDTISPPSRFSRPNRPSPNFRDYESPKPLELDTGEIGG